MNKQKGDNVKRISATVLSFLTLLIGLNNQISFAQATQSLSSPPNQQNQTPDNQTPHNQTSQNRTPQPALTVETIKPKKALIPRTLSFNGSILPWQIISVDHRLSGVALYEVYANIGDTVKKGQLLAQYDTQPIALELAMAQAQLEQAQAAAQEAQRNAQAVHNLSDTNALSTSQIQQILTQDTTAKANLAKATAQVSLQQLRLHYTRVIAPDNGTIIARHANIGAVSPTGSELFKLIRQNRLEWRGEITAKEYPELKPGLPVRIMLNNGSSIQTKIRQIAPNLDPTTRTALVYADIPKNQYIASGMFLRGEVEVGQQSALLIPQTSLVLRDGFSYVFTYDPKNKRIQQIKVETGQRLNNDIEIVSGLTEHNQVVRNGVGFLNDGDRVRIAP